MHRVPELVGQVAEDTACVILRAEDVHTNHA